MEQTFSPCQKIRLEPLQKPYILIVEANPHNFVSFKTILNEWEPYLIFATSAKEALRHILLYDFAVILLDGQMPGMDSFEIAKLIRSREKSSYTPIIFLRNAFNPHELEINQGYALGIVDYILKPINPLILRSKIKVFVDFFKKSTLVVNSYPYPFQDISFIKPLQSSTIKAANG